MAKYIFVTGGVVSSLGKGIAAASIGCLLESRGLKVTCQKFDPYLNVDPGTMSPFQHGEVFVTDDGAETDLDLGHYERFTHAKLTQSNNLTSGRIYEQIIARERRGDYLGKTVQVIPHVTNEIKAAMKKRGAGRGRGDRGNRRHGGRHRIAAVPRSHPPDAPRAGPRQLPVRARDAGALDRRRAGAEDQAHAAQRQGTARHRHPAGHPAVPLASASSPQEMKEKIALFCDVDVEAVITARDVKSVYEVPLMFAGEGVDEIVLRLLRLDAGPRDLGRWTAMLERMENPRDEVTIGLVGKYVEYEDSYKSLKEALLHGGLAHQLKVNINWIEAEGVVGDGLGKAAAKATTASWCRAASASAASRACSTPSATRASARCRISASAWACRPW